MRTNGCGSMRNGNWCGGGRPVSSAGRGRVALADIFRSLARNRRTGTLILEGPDRRVHENGRLEVKARYRNGLRDGAYAEYFQNGQKAIAGRYREGRRVGEWTQWHPDGSPAARSTWEDGELASSQITE